MNQLEPHGRSVQDEQREDRQLLTVLADAAAAPGAGPVFDHDALVLGTWARARRIRRRRAIAQGAVATVMVPGLVGAGWMVLHPMSGDIGPAGATVASQVSVPPAGTSAEPASGVSAGAIAEPAAGTGAELAEVTGTPYQDPSLLPELVSLDRNPDLPNAVDLPDPRPTGIPELDALGSPEAWLYPRLVPLLGFVAARDNIGLDPDTGIEPHSGRDFSWIDDEALAAGEGVYTVVLNVTAWDDAGVPMEQLRTGGTELSTFWAVGAGDGGLVVGVPDPLPWPEGTDPAGAAGDLDRLLVGSSAVVPTGGALVRQGDLLVGVTVEASDLALATDLAARVADRAAANLAVLDRQD